MAALRPIFEDFVAAAAWQAGVDARQVRGPSRRRPLPRARQRVVLLTHHLRPDLSFGWVARQLGRRDRSSICYAYDQASQRFVADAEERRQVLALLAEFGHDELPPVPAEWRSLRLLNGVIKIQKQRLAQLLAQRAALGAGR